MHFSLQPLSNSGRAQLFSASIDQLDIMGECVVTAATLLEVLGPAQEQG